MGSIIAVVSKKGENATETAVTMLKTLEHEKTETFGIASPNTVRIERSIKALENQQVDSPIIVGYAFSRILNSDKPQPKKLENAALVVEGRFYRPATEILAADRIAKELQLHPEALAETLVQKSEGDFTFVIAEAERIIAGRDVMGTRPLYYGENSDLAALSSERKALWKASIEETYSFPPGHLALIDKHGFKFKPARTLTVSKPKQITMETAAKKLQSLLQQSLKERLLGLKEVAVAFSGGLDSSIIAFLAKKTSVDVHLIHVSLENQSETDHAKRVAEELKLPIHVYTYNEDDVEKIVRKVLWLIEEPDPVKTSIAIPIYWTAEKTADINLKVLLAGQGADELFGGYKRYVDDYLQYGSEKAQEAILNGIAEMHEANFERDFKICNYHNTELRLPFAAYEIAKFATALPLELKIERSKDTLRKLVLRRAAQNIGLPRPVVGKPKKAMQYATGVAATLKKLAKRRGLLLKEYLQKMFQETFKDDGA
jgi:asparagine synthase (glutamine-hydrolysing)